MRMAAAAVSRASARGRAEILEAERARRTGALKVATALVQCEQRALAGTAKPRVDVRIGPQPILRGGCKSRAGAAPAGE
jgi:hypothetical protein